MDKKHLINNNNISVISEQTEIKLEITVKCLGKLVKFCASCNVQNLPHLKTRITKCICIKNHNETYNGRNIEFSPRKLQLSLALVRSK